jgi:hypothetical protein
MSQIETSTAACRSSQMKTVCRRYERHFTIAIFVVNALYVFLLR